LKWRAIKRLGRGDELVEVEFPRELRIKGRMERSGQIRQASRVLTLWDF
jgi:hypothetical protein